MKSIHEMMSGKNINFLIGSGASSPLYPTLSLGEDLPSFEDFVSSDKISEFSRKLLYCHYYFKWISSMELSKLNDQKTDENYKEVTENYQTFIEKILDILDSEGNEKPKRVNIFTTNYDLLFEDAFDVVSQKNPLCFFNDGSRGFITHTLDSDNFYLNLTHSGCHDCFRREVPTVNLMKMHGSVSWEKRDIRICTNYDGQNLKDLDQALTNISGYDVTEIDRIFFTLDKNKGLEALAEDLEAQLSSICVDRSQLELFFMKYETLPIINPNKWKFHDTVFEQHYYQMIRSFSYEMEKENTILVVFAFSFADEHILDIFKRSLLNPLLQVIIISYDENGQQNLKEVFSGFKNISYYPDIFTSEDKSLIQGNFEYLINLLRGQI